MKIDYIEKLLIICLIITLIFFAVSFILFVVNEYKNTMLSIIASNFFIFICLVIMLIGSIYENKKVIQ